MYCCAAEGAGAWQGRPPVLERFVNPATPHRCAALALAALLSGCASMAPPYERPAAPVAAVFPDAAAAGTPAGTPAAELAWQQFFVDARLRRLIELSLQNNRDLRVAVLNIERVRAQYQIQRAEQFPTVVLGATG